MRTSKNRAGFLKNMRVTNVFSVCNTDFYRFDGFLWSFRSSVSERTSINDAQVSINHEMFSVFNAGFLCAMRVFYVATGSSVCNAGLLCSCRVFYMQYGSSV